MNSHIFPCVRGLSPFPEPPFLVEAFAWLSSSTSLWNEMFSLRDFVFSKLVSLL
jgi:hypothetical protein